MTLFALEPGQTTEGLRLSTRQVDLSERPSYECISYNRLPSVSKSYITLDGVKILVPATLTSAFNALRRKDRPRIIWAQTLSASHRHKDAPPLQAAEAKSVLKSADKTIFWMDIKGLKNTAKAFGMMKELAKHYASVVQITNFPLRLSQASRHQMQAMLDYFTNIPKEPFQVQDEALWSDINSIFSQQYWNDLATLPEVLLPNHVVITEGKRSMSWKEFSDSHKAVVNLMRFLPHYKMDKTLWSTLDYITRTRVRCAEDNGVELLPVLQSMKQMTCADPRDHIFALLPLVIPSPRVAASGRVAQIPPSLDYSSTTQAIYIAAAQYMITERQDFCIWWAEYPPMHRTIPGMPSWVPDFHHSPETATPAHLQMGTPSYEKWTSHMQHTGKAKLITVSPSDGKSKRNPRRPFATTLAVSRRVSAIPRNLAGSLDLSLAVVLRNSQPGIEAQAHILDRIKWISPIIDPNANKAAHTNPFWVANSATSKMIESFEHTQSRVEIINRLFTTLILNHVGLNARRLPCYSQKCCYSLSTCNRYSKVTNNTRYRSCESGRQTSIR